MMMRSQDGSGYCSAIRARLAPVHRAAGTGRSDRPPTSTGSRNACGGHVTGPAAILGTGPLAAGATGAVG